MSALIPAMESTRVQTKQKAAMARMTKRCVGALWALHLPALACQARETPVAEAAVAASEKAAAAAGHDIDALSQKITLPVRPAAAAWQERQLNNTKGGVAAPTDYLIVAVLQYGPAQAEQVAAAAAQRGSAPSETEYLPWFPAELGPLIKQNEDGKPVLQGPGYQAKDYFRSPYRAGEFVRVGTTGYFVLRLITM